MIAPAPPSARPLRPLAVLAVAGLGTLFSAMSGSMVNLALPTLGRDLHISLDESRWIVQSLLLVVGVLLLPCGRLSDIFGHRRVYLAGFAILGGASLGCGLANDYPTLVFFRCLQGVSGALAMAAGPALLTTTFPAARRGRALGLLATATYLGLTVGPPLGGWVVSVTSWRAVFLLNVPVSVLVFAAGLCCLPRPAPTAKAAAPFDWRGATLLVAALPLLLVFLAEGTRWGSDTVATWLVGAGGLGGLAALLLVERRRAAPILDLGLFRSRMFSGAALSAVANYTALFGALLMLPFYLEEGLGRRPEDSGLLLAAQPLVMALVASPSGWLSDRIGSRALATLGMAIVAVGLGGLALLGAAGEDISLAAWLGVVGFGTGIFVSPNSSALMGAAPATKQGAAGAILAEARVLGMLLGTALASTVFRAGGGLTGRPWQPQDFSALSVTLWVAAGAAALGALAASLRGQASPANGSAPARVAASEERPGSGALGP